MLDPAYLNRMEDAYGECAIWTSVVTTIGGDDIPADAIDDGVATDTWEAFRADCAEYLAIEEVATILERLQLDPAQVGHDLWLTRNRHGAGFWDRDLGADGEVLTRHAHLMGEQVLYLGGDGVLRHQ